MRKSGMEPPVTAVYLKVPEGYVAFVEGLPGANTQGATLEEARANLREAVSLVLEANRALAEDQRLGSTYKESMCGSVRSYRRDV